MYELMQIKIIRLNTNIQSILIKDYIMRGEEQQHFFETLAITVTLDDIENALESYTLFFKN